MKQFMCNDIRFTAAWTSVENNISFGGNELLLCF